MTEFTDLIAMKKSRKTPQKGDVFVVQPFQSVFYRSEERRVGKEC